MNAAEIISEAVAQGLDDLCGKMCRSLFPNGQGKSTGHVERGVQRRIELLVERGYCVLGESHPAHSDGGPVVRLTEKGALLASVWGKHRLPYLGMDSI